MLRFSEKADASKVAAVITHAQRLQDSVPGIVFISVSSPSSLRAATPPQSVTSYIAHALRVHPAAQAGTAATTGVLYKGYPDRRGAHTGGGVNYTHALVVRLKSAAALETYATHPGHLALVAKIKPLLDTSDSQTHPPLIAIDYPVSEISDSKAEETKWLRDTASPMEQVGMALGLITLGAGLMYWVRET